MKTNKLYNMNHMELFPQMPDNCIDLTVTSPPYGKLRNYYGFKFCFHCLARELYRVTKPGGVVVWVVSDQVVKGSESGDRFRQALYFMSIGFKLHDTMYYEKEGILPNNDGNRYEQMIEEMYVFTKGAPKTANLLLKKNKCAGEFSQHGKNCGSFTDKARTKTKTLKKRTIKEFGVRGNVWRYGTGANKSTKDRVAFLHPAIFPEKLAEDHILTWTDPGDLVFDPMAGSGTVGKVAAFLDRDWLMCEISHEYCRDIIPLRMPSMVYKREEMELKGENYEI